MTKDLEVKEEKLGKVMKNNEQLGQTILTLKGKINEHENVISENAGIIQKQIETIKIQNTAINDLNIRAECNKDVAVRFMDEVLQNDEETEENETPKNQTNNEQIAQLFKDLQEERGETDQSS